MDFVRRFRSISHPAGRLGISSSRSSLPCFPFLYSGRLLTLPLSLCLALGLPLLLNVGTLHIFIAVGILLHRTAGMVVTADIVFTAGFVQLPEPSLFIERLLEASGEGFINLHVVLNLGFVVRQPGFGNIAPYCTDCC